MSRKFQLREFAYFDRQKVEDFLSSIEDGLTRERKEIKRKIEVEAKGELNIGVAKLGGRVGRKGLELEELKGATDASLFQRLYVHLQKEQLIQNLDLIDESRWSEIKVGDIIEVGARFELSAMDLIIDLFTYYSAFVKEGLDEKRKVALHFIKMIGSRDGFNVKISLKKGARFKFIAYLPTKNVRVSSKREIEDEYTILCRVRKVLKPKEKFNLFSLPSGIKLPKEIVRNLIRTVPPQVSLLLGKSLSMEDFEVNFPAIVVTPIAIYR